MSIHSIPFDALKSTAIRPSLIARLASLVAAGLLPIFGVSSMLISVQRRKIGARIKLALKQNDD